MLYPASRLAGSGICPSLTGPPTATSTTAAPTATPTGMLLLNLPVRQRAYVNSLSQSQLLLSHGRYHFQPPRVHVFRRLSQGVCHNPHPLFLFFFTATILTSLFPPNSTGNVAALGNWNPTNGVALNASQYTNNNPLWTGTLKLAPGTNIQYKFVKVSSSGAASWESDPNRSYTVPCAAASVGSSWK